MSINVTAVAVTDDIATLTLSSVTGLVVGETVHVYNTGYNKINGVHQITVISGSTIKYPVNNMDDLATTSVTGVLLEDVTWIDTSNVTEFLGIATATANDTAYLGTCVAAANAFAYRRRHQAGYHDSPVVVPNDAVRLGTVLYAAGLYRERGSVDSFQSYDSMNMPLPTMSMGRVLQLLGVGRPQVG
jgi:hypothetical protein